MKTIFKAICMCVNSNDSLRNILDFKSKKEIKIIRKTTFKDICMCVNSKEYLKNILELKVRKE